MLKRLRDARRRRRPDAGRDPRLGRQPGRPQQRADRARTARPSRPCCARRSAAPASHPADVQYVEAHGTGTDARRSDRGRGVGAVLGAGRGADQPLVIGSVKTNIGHLESAAGHRRADQGRAGDAARRDPAAPALPRAAARRSRGRRSPSSCRPSVTPWPAVDGRRVAGVSGFGFSGTNAHVVLESPPATPCARPASTAAERGSHGCWCCRRGPASRRREVAGRLGVLRWRRRAVALAEVCATADAGRAHLAASPGGRGVGGAGMRSQAGGLRGRRGGARRRARDGGAGRAAERGVRVHGAGCAVRGDGAGVV